MSHLAATHPAVPRRRGRRVPGLGAQRGAILVQTAIILLGLTGLSAFVIDYGVLWTARRQIQNAADAAAMAAATSLAFDVPGDLARAQANALTAVANNLVWGEPASMQASDVTLVPCPAGKVGSGECVQVQVFRNQDHNSGIRSLFGQIVGVDWQNVRATATAQVLYGDSTDCVKPMALPDRWEEFRNNNGPLGWDVTDTFERYSPGGALLPGGIWDIYTPPVGGAGSNGSGFSRGPTGFTAGDYGLRLEVSASLNPLADKATAQHFMPVQVDGIAGPAAFLQAMEQCSTRTVLPGDVMDVELANIDTQLGQGAQTLYNRDPGAYWDFAKNGGRGGVSGGCMASGDCVVSPRIIALPVYDPDAWDRRLPGTVPATISRVVGFFVDVVEISAVAGRLMVYPITPRSTMTASPESSFVISVTLVR